MLDLVSRGMLSPVVHGVYPLEEAQTVHRLVAGRENFGKVLLKP